MKKLRIMITLLVFIGVSIYFNKVFALTSNDLISVGSGNYAITVSKTSTIQDIIDVLGEPKLVTKSAFGGYAYAFYTDDNYSNYLYIETMANGQIISFGSVDPTYKTNTYSYGDKYNYSENGVLHGCISNVDGIIKGAVHYNKSIGEYNEIFDIFKSNYESNPTKYLRGISEHSVLMYNAFCTSLGYNTHLEFDEDFFYINEQFKEFGTSIREYLMDMGKTSYIKAIGNKENIELSNGSFYIMNPMEFASLAVLNKGAKYEEKTVAIFDYNYDTKLLSAICISKDAFKRYEDIELTLEENEKLIAGREKYAEAISKLYAESGLYDVEPQSTNPSTMVAGELKQSKKEGITAYVNAIRIAAGLPEVSLDEDAFLVAQHISTLISYRYTELGLPIQHYPPKPDGLSDEYYNIAVRHEMGFAENLGYSATASTEKTMMKHINLFLDDGSETPQVFSHRSKILDPGYSKFGYGISPFTFSNEFSGSQSNDVFLQAWPAEGITFIESLANDNKRFKWTARFLDKYTVTSGTTVTVKCLNTDETWEFTDEVGDTNSSVYFKRYTDSVQSINNNVVFYDSSIVPENGYVYQITVHNLQNDDTGLSEDYTYRSVFEYADEANIPVTEGNLSIDIDSEYKNSQYIHLEDELSDTGAKIYRVPIGVDVKFKAISDESVTDNKVTWSSSNPNVKVMQNGLIVAEGGLDEEVTIKVKYDGSEEGSTIVVIPYYKIDQIKIGRVSEEDTGEIIDPGNTVSEVLKDESINLRILYIPDYATEETTIEWKVISKTSPTVEYDISDPYIRQYLAVDILNEEKTLVKVTAVNAETSNNEYTVKAYANGISGTYDGTYNVEVEIPLNYIRIVSRNAGVSFSGGALSEPRYATIDYNKYLEQNDNSNILDLYAEFAPDNTTVDRKIEWNTDNSSVLTDYDQSGKFRIDSEGQATITAYNEDGNYTAYMYLTITSELESVSISSDNSNIKLQDNGSGVYTAEDTLKTEKYPSIDSDKIIYKSSNEDIATVDENGKVTFKDKGQVTITAYSEADESIKDEFTYNVGIPVTSMYFNYAFSTQYVKLGEKIQYEAVYLPLQANVKNYITYSSSNTDVATVDKNGIVTTKSCGTTRITATLDGKYTETGYTMTSYYDVNVHVPIESISTDDKLTIMLEDSVVPDITLEINPANTTDSYSVRWESSDESVLTVDKTSGKITPIKSGKATVTAIVTATNDRGTTEYRSTTTVTVKSINDPQYLKGDLDRNGAVNANDAAKALDLYKYGNATDEDMQIGDMNEDGTINANDAALILDVYKYGR